MNIENKNILIIGLGISGVSTAKALDKLGGKIIIADSKSADTLKEYKQQLSEIDIEYFLEDRQFDLEKIDIAVKSPGVPFDLELIDNLQKQNIEVVTDIELAYRLCKNKFIAITGTNGKTTTTALTGEIFKNSNVPYHIAGNIGVGILWEVVNSKQDEIFIVETSSFQLQNTVDFKPYISLVTNITPDHLNWHKTIEHYRDAKKKVFKNQDKYDFTVLNYDDSEVRSWSDETKAEVIFFSTREKLSRGIYIEDNWIVIDLQEDKIRVLKTDELKILGRHNLENALSSIAIAYCAKIDLSVIRDTLREFEGVEHRLEFVKEIEGVRYYNDSKGTNPDASIKAIESIPRGIILIAGGMDKGSEFDEFIESFSGRVKSLVLLGETKEKIRSCANKKGFLETHLVSSIEDAVRLSHSIGVSGDTVLLSPACASWDMFKSYEERGEKFKNAVYKLEEA